MTYQLVSDYHPFGLLFVLLLLLLLGQLCQLLSQQAQLYTATADLELEPMHSFLLNLGLNQLSSVLRLRVFWSTPIVCRPEAVGETWFYRTTDLRATMYYWLFAAGTYRESCSNLHNDASDTRPHEQQA
jgi:hypothetical protein